MTIDKDITLSMRGLAILSICLHNFIHKGIWGYAQQNELEFEVDNTRIFFEHISHASSFFTIVAELISFIGWFGVPVFVFLSGYGIIMKYKGILRDKAQKLAYIKHSYTKLLLLTLPAAVFFVIPYLISGYWSRVVEILFSLTFLNSLFSVIIIKLHYVTSSFWYFSLAFQLYLVFLIIGNVSKKKLYVWGGVFLFIQMLINPIVFGQKPISYMHYNFIAWLPVFLSGMLTAKAEWPLKTHLSLYCFITLVSIPVIIVMNMNYYSWVLMPFVCVAFFYSLSKVLYVNKLLFKIPIWLGKNSMYIFVSHPIAIFLVLKLMEKFQTNGIDIHLPLALVIYLLLTIGIVFIYKFLHQALSSCRLRS